MVRTHNNDQQFRHCGSPMTKTISSQGVHLSKSSNSPDAKEVSTHVSTPSPISGKISSYNKLLSSHLSIYHALNNPDLELSPRFSLKERFPTPDNDLAMSLASWQSISLPDEEHKVTPSILSITSDDEDSLVRIPSALSRKDSVMVFDTDEEDEDEEKTLTVNLNPVVETSSISQFIMPKMTLSDPGKMILITFVLSSDLKYRQEVAALVKDTRTHFSGNIFQFHHATLQRNSDAHTHLLIRNSQLIFIINDGSLVFVEELSLVFEGLDFEDDLRVTVINLMTANYFSNLFELINCLKPYQIWKTSSLKQQKLMSKLWDFVSNEASDDSLSAQGGGKYNQEYCKKMARMKVKSTSVYANLAPTKKTDYKCLEKQMRSELQGSTVYDNIDPLQLSTSFYHVNILFSFFKKCSASVSRSGNLWLFCSFTVGIGLGVGIASGVVTVCGRYISRNVKSLFRTLKDEDKKVSAPHMSHFMEVQNQVMNTAVDAIDGSLALVANTMEKVVELPLIQSLSSTINFWAGQLTSLNSLLIESVKGGFSKACGQLLQVF